MNKIPDSTTYNPERKPLEIENFYISVGRYFKDLHNQNKELEATFKEAKEFLRLKAKVDAAAKATFA
jgi:hypothetical protein